MGQIVTQGLSSDLLAVLTTPAGLPATGLIFSSVQCQFRKEGDPTFKTKVLTALTFIEAGQGFYRITFNGTTELTVPGSFAFTVFGPTIQQFYGEAQVRAASSLIPTVSVALPMCQLTGNINDLSGEPVVGAAISARIIGMPTILTNVGMTDSLQTTVTDDNGVFVLSIARTAVVDVFIPKINYRRQLTVPNLPTADLFLGIP